MDELVKEATRGFVGGHFNEAVYKGEKYVVEMQKGKFFIFSEGILSEKTEPFSNIYITELTIEELTDLFESSLTATYKGNNYKVGVVSSRAEKVEIIGNYEDHYRDEPLGITYSEIDGCRHKFVPLEELDGIVFNRKSIYEEVKKQLEEKKTGLKM